MSDFLTRLAQRQLGQIASVEPRVPELYAPVSAALPLPIADTPATILTPPRIAEPSSPPAVDADALNIPAAAPVTARQREASGESSAPQRTEANSSEKISRRATERVDAEIASLVMENASVEPHSIAISSAPRLVTENPDSLPLRQELRAARESTMHDAPQRLVDDRVTTVAAAPPRLEPKLRERAPTPPLERGPADSEPPVHVTIGRIEVTTVTAAPTQRRAATTRKPAMALDDYLARRQRGES